MPATQENINHACNAPKPSILPACMTLLLCLHISRGSSQRAATSAHHDKEQAKVASSALLCRQSALYQCVAMLIDDACSDNYRHCTLHLVTSVDSTQRGADGPTVKVKGLCRLKSLVHIRGDREGLVVAASQHLYHMSNLHTKQHLNHQSFAATDDCKCRCTSRLHIPHMQQPCLLHADTKAASHHTSRSCTCACNRQLSRTLSTTCSNRISVLGAAWQDQTNTTVQRHSQ